MRNILEIIKKGFRIAGFVFTWPVAQLYRVIRFLEEIQLGSLFVGLAFLICIVGGISDYAAGVPLSKIMLFYVIFYLFLAGAGAWAINTALYLLLCAFRPVYRANQKCATHKKIYIRARGVERNKKRNRPEHNSTPTPLDKFIKLSAGVKSYEMKRL